ncbi:MAG: aminotransferase class V-fold PLP-dependent enzyme [Clostridia bacterium]|nr:aminotransferase class V-fold PLP-dependent enzyme [Clostridia bacterium]
MQVYFDNAATSSPKPQAVQEAVLQAMREFNANPGRSGHSAAIRAAHCVYEAREALASLIHAGDSASVSFHFNCTDALNLAIKGSVKRGDHVISTMLEHNSVLRPLSGMSSRGEIALTLVSPRPDGMVYPEDIRASLRKNTRLIAVTHASNVTGAIQPVAAIGQVAGEAGIPFLIDGAQALGGMPVDVGKLRCSYYAFPGHKSLLGPQGTGGLYVKPGMKLRPLIEGGTGTDSDSMLQPDVAPECYESGTVNLPGIAGLKQGVDYVAANQAQIMMHERELCAALYEGIRKMPEAVLYSPAGEAARAGIVSFNLGDLSSSEAADALSQRGIAVRGGLHCAPGAHRHLGTLRRGAVRASVGHANTFEEVDFFLKSVQEIIRA